MRQTLPIDSGQNLAQNLPQRFYTTKTRNRHSSLEDIDREPRTRALVYAALFDATEGDVP